MPQKVKNPPAEWETWVRSLGWEDPLEEVMATHSRGARKTGKPCGLQSVRSQRVGHGWVTKHSRKCTDLYTRILHQNKWRTGKLPSRWLNRSIAALLNFSQRVRHNWSTFTFTFLSVNGEGNGNPFQYSCLENRTDRGAWWATVHWVTELNTTEWLSQWMGYLLLEQVITFNSSHQLRLYSSNYNHLCPCCHRCYDWAKSRELSTGWFVTPKNVN